MAGYRLNDRQYGVLRHYADGRTHNDLGRPIESLLLRGLVERVCDDFYRVTTTGSDALAAYENTTRKAA